MKFLKSLWAFFNTIADNIDMSVCDECGFDNCNRNKPDNCYNCGNKLTLAGNLVKFKSNKYKKHI